MKQQHVPDGSCVVSATLHARLRAAIEEKLAIARAATEGPWVEEYSGETGPCVIPADAESTREFVARTQLYAAVADAKHIATHNPAWAIRQHEAALRVLERHHFVECSNVRCSDGGWCVGCDPDGSAPCSVHPWPCPAVLTLAELYSVPVDTEEADRG